MSAAVAGRPLRDVAREALALARSGLSRRAGSDEDGRDETHYLDVLDEIADSGRTRAERLLARFRGEWGGSVEPAFQDCVF